MASKSETTAIIRALLSLVTAVDEIDDALVELAPTQDQQFRDHVLASREARNQCLELIQALVMQTERNRE
jgi:hypothetical protein